MLKPTRVNFKGIDELVVTFKADESLNKEKEGKLVKVTETDAVGAAHQRMFLNQWPPLSNIVVELRTRKGLA